MATLYTLKKDNLYSSVVAAFKFRPPHLHVILHAHYVSSQISKDHGRCQGMSWNHGSGSDDDSPSHIKKHGGSHGGSGSLGDWIRSWAQIDRVNRDMRWNLEGGTTSVCWCMPGAKKHFFEPSQSFPILFNKFKRRFPCSCLGTRFYLCLDVCFYFPCCQSLPPNWACAVWMTMHRIQIAHQPSGTQGTQVTRIHTI